MATQKESIEKLIKTMKSWQNIEDASVKNTGEIMKKTDNPLIQIVMEIIKQDSVMHRRVQQLIIDHFEKKPISISPDELAVFWDMVEEHDAIEKKTIELAKISLKETNSQLVKYLLEYLLTDEIKHDKLLEEMEKIKKGMYPYGGM
jgi:hypothetical protein